MDPQRLLKLRLNETLETVDEIATLLEMSVRHIHNVLHNTFLVFIVCENTVACKFSPPKEFLQTDTLEM